MRITGTGHASMRIDTAAGSILCDPWVNPAYFASWFPFPDNSQLDWGALGDCDYLYVSHLHADHYLGLPIYDRYVLGQQYCMSGEVARGAGVPTVDKKYCPVKKCVESEIFRAR